MRDLVAQPHQQIEASDREKLIVRRISESQIKKAKSLLSSVTGLEKMPTLLEFLTATTLEGADGATDREPPTIFMLPREGVLQVTLKEPSQRLRLRVDVANPVALWPTLEAALANPGSLWEVDPFAAQKRPGKKR